MSAAVALLISLLLFWGCGSTEREETPIVCAMEYQGKWCVFECADCDNPHFNCLDAVPTALDHCVPLESR